VVSGVGEPLRLGVVGCADIAWRRTLPALAGVAEVSLAALGSRDPDKAARFAARFGGVPVTGYDRLLERADVDAVYIALPAAMHAAWVERALHAGKHVLAEKPLTLTHPDARRLVDLARRLGLTLLENFMFVVHSQHVEVRKLLADGLVGELRGISAAFTIPPLPGTDIRYRPDLGAGALADVGGYPLRAARLFLGDELAVSGAVLRTDPRRGVDLGGAALLSTTDGRWAQVSFGMEHGYRCEYELFGTSGRIRVDRALTAPASHQPVVRVERPGLVEHRTLAADDHFANALRAFAHAVRTGEDGGLGGAAILGQAALVDRIRAAARRADVAAG
jgi:dTDP-3,4-didehydro-2,6-dideoxy-alpha-D-glucose 3-reductase